MKRSNRATSAAALGAVILSLAVAASGCTSNPGDTQGSLHKYSGPTKVKTLEQTRAEERGAPSVVTVKTIQNSDYVALGDVARAIGFQARWLNDGSYGIGDNDAYWRFQPGESTARVGDDKVKLPAPTLKESNRLYAPVSGLKKLFGEVAAFRADSETVSFYPVTDQLLKNGIKAQTVNPRMEAREEGIRKLDDGDTSDMGDQGSLSTDSGQASDGGSSSSSDDADDLIVSARKFLGVKYDFGAGEYEETGKFDCSSFVKMLYAKYGVSMPRVARNQAEVGKKVSREELKKGDLLYFYVPGRFKTDETVGHVGIYMGDGNMIHASPEPEDGVQITPIDKPYWARTFLFAKRVLPE